MMMKVTKNSFLHNLKMIIRIRIVEIRVAEVKRVAHWGYVLHTNRSSNCPHRIIFVDVFAHKVCVITNNKIHVRNDK